MHIRSLNLFLYSAALALVSCSSPNTPPVNETCETSVHILGIGQDGGKPQISVHDDPAWIDAATRALASSIAVVEKSSGARYLFDATPEMKAQLYVLDQRTGSTGFRLDGVFLTHGHMGHYLGLAQLGREAMGAKSVPVYAMPKMASFIEDNGPWDQLVALNNIELKPLTNESAVNLSGTLNVTPFVVPHRGEYTETVGYRIQGKNKSAIYLPDIDSWEQWETQGGDLEALVADNDYLFIDGTFYSGDELPGRDMSTIPHPTITHTMEKLRGLDSAARKKVHFIHLNHSNPAHDKHTNAYEDIEKAGYSVARMGAQHCLD